MKGKNVPKRVVAQVANEEIVAKKQERIARAAGELFSIKGYHHTTMRDISRASGINLAYLYQYVSSKDDILYLFYMHLYKQWSPIFQSLEDESQDPVDQLKIFLRSMLELIHKLHNELVTMYGDCRYLERESLHSVLAAESETIKSLEKLIIRGIGKGVFRTKDPCITANIIQYLVTFEALRGWNFRDRVTFTRTVELVQEFVLRALGVGDKKDK